MRTVANKRTELYLDQLRLCLADFPSGTLEEGESPDFIIRDGAQATGIEFTIFRVPPSDGQGPHQELQTFKDRVVRIASMLHAYSGGPALYVYVFFNEELSPSRHNAEQIGHALSATVLDTKVPGSLEEGAIRVARDKLPEGISNIAIYATLGGRDRLWSADEGGWVASVQPDHIQAIVDNKKRMLEVARTKCSNVWLVIVNDEFGPVAPSDLSEAAAHFQYSHEFDRLVWLQAHLRSALVLGREG
jgi:hypothetical protein